MGGLGAFEDFIDVAACPAQQIGYIGTVNDLSAIGEYSEEIKRGEMMLALGTSSRRISTTTHGTASRE
jgi:hypothetical protein